MSYSDNILRRTEKPGRYVGNEINMVVKSIADIDIHFAFAFPDIYEVGMSHLGLQILYHFFNRREDVYCERVFTPWVDMEQQLRENNLPLCSLETHTPLSDFNFIGFTLQYEMSYSNILNMLSMSNIPIFSKDRGESFPIICAGGPCAYNPEPLADFVDFFYLGEGEAGFDEIFDIYNKVQKNGGGKAGFLEALVAIPWVYVPKFYDVTYADDGRIKAFTPNNPNAPKAIKKIIAQDLSAAYFPDKQLIPLIEIVHDRVCLEVFRGCIRGCRFCQAGFVYRPNRERECQDLLKCGQNLLNVTGHEEISLLSLATNDYTQLEPLIDGLLSTCSNNFVNISLPSLRLDAMNFGLLERVQKVRKSGLTFAPEAGSQRLRDVINKNINEQEILDGCKMAFDKGWSRLKLYFMIGLPTETDADILGISQLAKDILDSYYSQGKRARAPKLSLSLSAFVPKPFTPFQWEAQNSLDEFSDKQELAKNSIRRRGIDLSYHSADIALLEGAFARGDRRLCAVLARAVELGCRFDSWSEHFDYAAWMQAFDDCGVDINFYTTRRRDYDEILPWDFIDVGVTKKYLMNESKAAYAEKTTADCRQFCSGCGFKCYSERGEQ